MKKKIIVSIVAVFAALAAGAWAIAKFVKRGSKKISEDLDYDMYNLIIDKLNMQ